VASPIIKKNCNTESKRSFRALAGYKSLVAEAIAGTDARDSDPNNAGENSKPFARRCPEVFNYCLAVRNWAEGAHAGATGRRSIAETAGSAGYCATRSKNSRESEHAELSSRTNKRLPVYLILQHGCQVIRIAGGVPK
jgi:hypothetical protein